MHSSPVVDVFFFGGHQTHQNHKKSPDSPAHVAFQLSCLKLFLQSHRLVGREAKVWPDSLFLGALQKAATLDIQQVTMCIYVKIRVFIYIYIYLHTSLYDYLQASTKVHVHVRLGELTIAAVALDEGAKPAAGSCFHNDWEAGFLVPVTWFQTCWWLICS
jgi:hypothetical protein